MNLLLTKRANVIRLEAELNAARAGGASHIGKVREAQKELNRERTELANLETRLRELKQHLECLTDL